MSFHPGASSRGSVRKYHQGWVHVKQNQTYQKMFAELRARKELRFYIDETRAMRAGANCQSCVDLRDLVDITLQNDKRPSNRNPEFGITLKLNGHPEVKLRLATSQERIVWARYIRAVGLSRLPSTTENLLPGQIHEMQDIIQHEKEQAENDSRQVIDAGEDPYYLNMNGNYPWFYPNIFSRHDAEQLLKQGSGHGNMLVRKRQSENAADEYDFAVSAMASSKPEKFTHYKMKWCPHSSSFQVALADGPHQRLGSMADVVAFFERRSNRQFRRLSVPVSPPSHDYEDQLFPQQSVYVNDPYNVRRSQR